MTERDQLMDVVRRARPDDLAAARTAATQSLLQEILSMDDTRASLRTPRDRRRARRLALVGIAAVMVTVVAIATVLTVDSNRGVQAAAQVRAALVDTAAVGSGRADVVVRYLDDDGRTANRHVEMVEFSGDDYAVWSSSDAPDGGMRVIDGEFYSSLFDDGVRTWYHETGPGAPNVPFTLDPRTLLDQLRIDSDFRETGHEEIDGVATTRLEATDPEGIPGRIAAFFIPGAFTEHEGGALQEVTVTSLDLWIGEDNLVRRLELRVTSTIVSLPEGLPEPTDEERDWESSFSMRFYDFGAPITIEPPAEYVELPDS